MSFSYFVGFLFHAENLFCVFGFQLCGLPSPFCGCGRLIAVEERARRMFAVSDIPGIVWRINFGTGESYVL